MHSQFTQFPLHIILPLKRQTQPCSVIFDINTTSVEVACRNNLFSFLQAIPQKVLITLSETNTKCKKSLKQS